MGTPLPANEPAELCPTCWGPGKPFGPGPTPKVIQLRLTRLLPGEFHTPELEQLLLTTHWLEQQAGPCDFAILDATFIWFVSFVPILSIASVRRRIDATLAFVSTQFSPCLLDYSNDLDDPAGVITFGGFASITWDLEGL